MTETKKASIKELRPDDKNINQSSARGGEMLRRSLQEYGAARSLVADKNMRIVAGNQTLEAAAAIGLDDVVVVPTDGSKLVVVQRTDIDLDTPRGRELAIADNRTNQVGYNPDPLMLAWHGSNGAELEKFWLPDELAALDLPDVDGLDLGDEDDEPTGDADAVPEVKDVPTSERGDLWILGEHRVLCGDSTNAEDVARLMNGERADLCFTSPPYNVGHIRQKGKDKTGRKYDLVSDDLSGDQYLEFLILSIRQSLNFSLESFFNVGLVEGNKRQIFQAVAALGDVFKDVIYWKKNRVAPHIEPGVVNNQVEFVFAFGDGKRKFKNAQFTQGSYYNVIEGDMSASNNYSDIHKATFPSYLPIHVIQNFVKKSGSVLDLFLGTGTTLIAAEETGRKCYGVEISPQYVDVIVKRWQDYTGKEAKHEDGRTFAEVSQTRLANTEES